MPVSWTAENDAKMFMAVLKVFEGPIPHARVAEELKRMGLDVTTKAVRHRISKLKNDAKAGRAPNYASRNLHADSEEKFAATPKTPKTPKKGTDPGTPNTETKRKRVLEDIGFHADDGVRIGNSDHPVFKKPMLGNTLDFSMENADYFIADDNAIDPQVDAGQSKFTPINCSTSASPTKAYSPILKHEEDEGHYADASDTGEYYTV